MDMPVMIADHLPMVKDTRPLYRPTYVGQWIDHLGRKATEIARATGISESHLSLIIAGKRPYVQSKLEAIADELGIHVGRLFYPPAEDDRWASLEGLDAKERETARRVIKGLRPPK